MSHMNKNRPTMAFSSPIGEIDGLITKMKQSDYNIIYDAWRSCLIGIVLDICIYHNSIVKLDDKKMTEHHFVTTVCIMDVMAPAMAWVMSLENIKEFTFACWITMMRDHNRYRLGVSKLEVPESIDTWMKEKLELDRVFYFVNKCETTLYDQTNPIGLIKTLCPGTIYCDPMKGRCMSLYITQCIYVCLLTILLPYERIHTANYSKMQKKGCELPTKEAIEYCLKCDTPYIDKVFTFVKELHPFDFDNVIKTYFVNHINAEWMPGNESATAMQCDSEPQCQTALSPIQEECEETI